MGKILIAGLDGSFRHFGIAKAWLDLDDFSLDVCDLKVIEIKGRTKAEKKTVRHSSDNLRCSTELFESVMNELKGVTTAFCEVPTGGQDYKSVIGFGITIGIYGGIAKTLPLLEVSPAEAKKAAVGTSTASKEEMIEWAMGKYPNAPWLMRRFKGKIIPVSKNEHVADGVAIIEAGLKVPEFKQTIAILKTAVLAA